jgi:soluble lytic murein transglycosylase-like protein
MLGSAEEIERYKRYDVYIEMWREEIDYNLVRAIIYRESSFLEKNEQYGTLGKTGVGVMGVTLTSAKAIERLYGWRDGLGEYPEVLFFPSINIKYGCGILREAFQRKGTWREALQEYGGRAEGYADFVLRQKASFSEEGVPA